MFDEEETPYERAEREKREQEIARYSKLNARAHVETVKEADKDPRSMAEKRAELQVRFRVDRYQMTCQIATELLAASMMTQLTGEKSEDGRPKSITAHMAPERAVNLAMELQGVLDHHFNPGISDSMAQLDALREQREKGIK